MARRIGVRQWSALVLRPVSLAAAILWISPTPAQEPSSAAAAAAMERLVVEAIERSEKSVVAISRVRRQAEGATFPETAPPPAIIPGLGTDPTDPAFVPSEFGTGVVIDGKGLIVTNYHVVGDHRTADYYIWTNRKPYPAKLKAADPWLDLAVLQVDSDRFKPMALGDARLVKKGQFVIALGNPYAIARDGQPSAAWGIVSNLQRQAPTPKRDTRATEGRETLHHWGTLIQSDVRLELGSSGGALVNLKGEMIGLTTSLAALYGYERPGGFAVPVDDDFKRALETLKTGRLPDYGFLGVAPRYLTMAERQRGRLGARVEDVVPATPASAAGLKSGDVITEIDSRPIADDLELIRYVSGLFADTPVALKVLRGSSDSRPGRVLTLNAKLSKKRVEQGHEGFSEVPLLAWRGMRVEYATASPMFHERNRDLDTAGCVGVSEVIRDSAGWKAGLRPGDFVSHVGKTRVTTPNEFYDAVATLDGDVQLKLTAVMPAKATRTVAPESQ
jgi:serine protease Do